MKIELEQVEPAEIENRSMEIIESELPHEIDPKLAPIIKRAVHTAADFEQFTQLQILIMLIICAFQRMLLIRHWKQLRMVLAL